MRLEQEVKKSDLSKNIIEFSKLISGAEPITSFWGGRYFQVKEKEGTCSVHFLAVKLLEFLKNHQDDLHNDIFSIKQRLAGVKIVKTIESLYVTTDEIFSKSNLITRIFMQIREGLQVLYDLYTGIGGAFYVREHFDRESHSYAAGDFLTFSSQSYLNKFGKEAEESLPYVTAEEKELRSLLFI